jgi:hypothetical protein
MFIDVSGAPFYTVSCAAIPDLNTQTPTPNTQYPIPEILTECAADV